MSDRTATERRGVAAYDFDGTLARWDCLWPFLVHMLGAIRVVAAFLRHSPDILRWLAGRVGNDPVKAKLLQRMLRGVPESRLREAGSSFAEAVIRRGWLREELVAGLEQHRAAGRELLIVSGSLAAYLDPLAERLGIDAVIAIRLGVDEAGRLTGEMLDGNVRGPRKVELLDAHLGPGAVELWAYGNSAGDDELLARAQHPVWVGRRSSRNPAA